MEFIKKPELSQEQVVGLVEKTPLRKPRERKPKMDAAPVDVTAQEGAAIVKAPKTRKPRAPKAVPSEPTATAVNKVRKENPWLVHTKAVKEKNPELTYKQVLSLAKESYTKA
jgi:hypothetical protein